MTEYSDTEACFDTYVTQPQIVVGEVIASSTTVVSTEEVLIPILLPETPDRRSQIAAAYSLRAADVLGQQFDQQV